MLNLLTNMSRTGFERRIKVNDKNVLNWLYADIDEAIDLDGYGEEQALKGGAE